MNYEVEIEVTQKVLVTVEAENIPEAEKLAKKDLENIWFAPNVYVDYTDLSTIGTTEVEE